MLFRSCLASSRPWAVHLLEGWMESGFSAAEAIDSVNRRERRILMRY
jgi:hypothetical protein